MTDASTRDKFRSDYTSVVEQLPSNSRTGQPPPPAGGGTPYLTLVNILAGNPKAPLPVPVDSELPSIKFTLGAPADGPSPSIRCVVDTGAGCNCANLAFCLALVIRCPQILHSSVVAPDVGLDPLTLAGVVSDDGLVLTTTELPIAMTFYTPYKSREGSQIF